MVDIEIRRPAISKLILLVLVLVLALSLGAVPARAAATTFMVNYTEELDLLVYVPCALGGTGEIVELSGPLHVLFTITSSSSGTYVLKYLNHPQGITGTGWSSGDKYQATGETGGTYTARIGFEETFINNFKIVGQGPGNNFMIHENFHFTVNPNGTLTVYADNFSVECKSSPSYP